MSDGRIASIDAARAVIRAAKERDALVISPNANGETFDVHYGPAVMEAVKELLGPATTFRSIMLDHVLSDEETDLLEQARRELGDPSDGWPEPPNNHKE